MKLPLRLLLSLLMNLFKFLLIVKVSTPHLEDHYNEIDASTMDGIKCITIWMS